MLVRATDIDLYPILFNLFSDISLLGPMLMVLAKNDSEMERGWVYAILSPVRSRDIVRQVSVRHQHLEAGRVISC